MRGLVAEPFEHHRATPDLPNRVRDAFARDVWRAAVDGFEQAREFALGVDVGAWRDADGARAGGAQIGEDVTEQIAGDDDVEKRRWRS